MDDLDLPTARGPLIGFPDHCLQPGQAEGSVGLKQTPAERKPSLAQAFRWLKKQHLRTDAIDSWQSLAIDNAMQWTIPRLPWERFQPLPHLAVMAHQQISDQFFLLELQRRKGRSHLMSKSLPLMAAATAGCLRPLALSATVGTHRGLEHRMRLADVMKPGSPPHQYGHRVIQVSP